MVEPAPANELSEEDRERLNKATSMFEWFQALENPLFEEVYLIMSVIQRQSEYAAQIIKILRGKDKK